LLLLNQDNYDGKDGILRTLPQQVSSGKWCEAQLDNLGSQTAPGVFSRESSTGLTKAKTLLIIL